VRVWDFSRDGVRRSLEQSCERMGLDRVDVALIHDPDDHWEAAINEAYPALEELRSEGAVAAIGVGMNQTAMLERFVAETDIDCVLSAGHYSLLDASAGGTLFPACHAAGIAVLAAGVYQSGILANPRPGATFNYATAPPEISARVSRIALVCAAHAVPLTAAALHYVLAHPAVTAVVVGARSAREAAENARQLNTIVPTELFDELAALGLVAPLIGAARD
jgi:D-threo-aldose 1-dehydrogenase